MWGSDQFWAEFVQPSRTCKPCVARGVVIQCDSGRICVRNDQKCLFLRFILGAFDWWCKKAISF